MHYAKDWAIKFNDLLGLRWVDDILYLFQLII